MPFNRIAIYGHRGWASTAIVKALACSGAPVRVLHQPTSDTSMLPANISTSSVDSGDEESTVEALKDIDIVISLVGHEGIARQFGLIKAIPKTQVKLFVPSDMSHEIDEQGSRIPVLKLKREVEEATRTAGIAMTLVRPCYLVESSMRTPQVDSMPSIVRPNTLNYVAAAYTSLFASTPISELSGRIFGISELSPTGDEIAKALEAKYGQKPEILYHSLQKIDQEIDLALDNGSPGATVWYYRRLWGAGKLPHLMGSDIWTVPDYRKMSLDELVVQDKLEAYRNLPQPVLERLLATFTK
ncbi:hypothetical protein V2A60_006406 [Cordyceps javanica]